MTTGFRKTHEFCWIDVMTPDVAAAKRFFGELLGWTFGEMPGVPGGTLIRVGERDAGALLDLEAPGFPPGTPPAIGVLIRVERADAAAAKVASLGGKVITTMDILENGRMAVCADPTGAVFSVWEPKRQQGMDVDSHAHGAPGWFEVLTTDAPRAVSFYAELFGWAVEERREVPGMVYRLFKLGDQPVGGAMQINEHMGQLPPHWGVSFSVRNADEVAKNAEVLGGEVCIPVSEIPGTGRFGLLRSPQGVFFHIIEWQR